MANLIDHSATHIIHYLQTNIANRMTIIYSNYQSIRRKHLGTVQRISGLVGHVWLTPERKMTKDKCGTIPKSQPLETVLWQSSHLGSVIQHVKTVTVEEKDSPLLSKLREPVLLEDQVIILVTVIFKPHLQLNLIQILIQLLLILLQEMDVIFLLFTNRQQILLILRE